MVTKPNHREESNQLPQNHVITATNRVTLKKNASANMDTQAETTNQTTKIKIQQGEIYQKTAPSVTWPTTRSTNATSYLKLKNY